MRGARSRALPAWRHCAARARSLFLGSVAALVALATYNSGDASLEQRDRREPTNLLGGLGATAADLLLQTFGIAALAALAPPAVWGVRALTGRTLSYAMWRAFAWPLGTVLFAAGLGVLPAPIALPAGAGGLIGLAAAGFPRMPHKSMAQHWIGIALAAAVADRGIAARISRDGHCASIRSCAGVDECARLLRVDRQHDRACRPSRSAARLQRTTTMTKKTTNPNDDDDDEEDDAYGLSVRPNPIAASPRSTARRA